MRFGIEFRPADVTLGTTYSLTDLGKRVSALHADTAGRPVRTILPNGVTQSQSFQNDGRLKAMTFSSSAVNQKLGGTFSWDHLDRLNTRTSILDDRYWNYAYDAVGQVTRYGLYRNFDESCGLQCPPPGPIREENYTYDAAGNRTDRGAVITAGTNRYSRFNGYDFEYDAEGNVTRKYTTGYDQRLTWNTLGQLTGVTTNGVAVTYGYDGVGRRVRRTENGQSRYFLYNGADLLLEADANGAPLRMYTYWPGVDDPHSVRVTNGGLTSTYYYVTEHPGHVTGLINEAGGVAAEYRYTPWGEIESASDPTGQPLGFMAREIDAATGLYYVRARWYDAASARFISQDPVGLAGGMNTYAYVGNDPVNRRDPSGLMFGQDPVVLPTIYITWSVSRNTYYVTYDPNSLWRAFNSREAADADDRLRVSRALGEFLEGAASHPRGVNRAFKYLGRRMGANGQCEMERAATEEVMIGVAVSAVGDAMRTADGRRLVVDVATTYVKQNPFRVAGRFAAGAVVTGIASPGIGWPANFAAGFGDVHHAAAQGRTTVEDFIGASLGGSMGPALESACR